MLHPLRLEELRRRARRGDAEAVHADHLFRFRIVDQRLRLATPAQGVVHGADNGEHRARGVDGIAAVLEHFGACGRTERLASDGHPMARVERRPLSAGGFDRAGPERNETEQAESDDAEDSHRIPEAITANLRMERLESRLPRAKSRRVGGRRIRGTADAPRATGGHGAGYFQTQSPSSTVTRGEDLPMRPWSSTRSLPME